MRSYIPAVFSLVLSALAVTPALADDSKPCTTSKIEALKAASHESAEAAYTLGMAYRTGSCVAVDYTESQRLLRKAAVHGNAMAMREMGCLYYKGIGLAPMKDEAGKWFDKAAAKGDAGSLFMLGTLARDGDGGQMQDYAKAQKLFSKAAAAGSVEAMKSMADMYEQGQGVSKEPAEAEKWRHRAAEAGNRTPMVCGGN